MTFLKDPWNFCLKSNDFPATYRELHKGGNIYVSKSTFQLPSSRNGLIVSAFGPLIAKVKFPAVDFL